MQISTAIHLMRETCVLRHFSLKTEKTYIYWVRRYSEFLKHKPVKKWTTEEKMERFLTLLATAGNSASTQNQAFNALLFFYRDVLKQKLGPVDSLRAKRQANPRHCPTPEEVRRLLAAVTDIYRYPTRLIVHLLYACGLRVTEPLNLRIKDVDLKESKLYLYQTKGGKGRVVLFPSCLNAALQKQMGVARQVAEQDHARRIATQDLLASVSSVLSRYQRVRI